MPFIHLPFTIYPITRLFYSIFGSEGRISSFHEKLTTEDTLENRMNAKPQRAQNRINAKPQLTTIVTNHNTLLVTKVTLKHNKKTLQS
jgi:hypothetical protein